MEQEQRRPTVFISFIQPDELWKDRLVEHLSILERQGDIDLWFRDRPHTEGAKAQSREKAIRDASVAILLISQPYLDNKTLWSQETKPLLDRKQAGGLSVIPVLIEPCEWKAHAWLVALRLRPRDPLGRAIAPGEEIKQTTDLVAIAREAYNLRGGPLAELRPRISDEATRRLAEALDEARARRVELRNAGANVASLDEKIKALQRELREGGRLQAGDWLGDGRYRLLEPLGKGGFATVWRALDTEREELVAIKVMHADVAGDPVRRERFVRGARQMAALEGEGIVRVLEPHGVDGGFHYFVMELIRGGDLQRAVIEKRVSGQDVLRLIVRVAGALARAHDAGVVHRDIKPANILLDEKEGVYLTDFDLVGERADSTGGTRTNQGLGTFGYAAPELLLNAKEAGPPADVYGLAMTAAFGLRGGELRELVLQGPAKIIAGLPCSTKVKATLTRAVASDPKDRYQDAMAFCEALRVAADFSRPLPSGSEKKIPGALWPMLYMAIASSVLCLLIATYYFFGKPGPTRVRAVEPASPALADAPKISAELKTTPEDSIPWSGTAEKHAAAMMLAQKAREEAGVALASLKFVQLDGARFQMGSPAKEPGRNDDEARHLAEVGSFEMSTCEVTQKQWTLIMSTRPFDCEYGCKDDMPAQNISWLDAIKFMNALTQGENQQQFIKEKRTVCYTETNGAVTWDRTCTGYRLPTEAEWEYAVRAGTDSSYSFGNNLKDLCAYGNGADLAANKRHRSWRVVQSCDDGYADLAPVGVFKPNAWGLYDMHGNIWEWVWDWYGPYPSESKLGYAGPSYGPGRVLRGGSFTPKPGGIRSSDRYWFGHKSAMMDIGFRIIRGVLQSSKIDL